MTLQQRCADIRLLIVDVDGVLTDGGIVYTSDKVELKHFHVRDGSAVKLWTRSGRQAALITGRQSSLVEVRAAELDIAFVYQGAGDKMVAYRQLLARSGMSPAEVCYVGDDLPDLPLLRNCGLAAAVADACPEARAEAHYITSRPGGRGAVREVIELVLRCQGEWQRQIERLRQTEL